MDFEQILDHMDKTDPGNMLYLSFLPIVKSNEQLPYKALTMNILSQKGMMVCRYINL